MAMNLENSTVTTLERTLQPMMPVLMLLPWLAFYKKTGADVHASAVTCASAVECLRFSNNTSSRLDSFSPLISAKVLSKVMAKKAASSGLSLRHVELAFQRSNEVGIAALFKEKIKTNSSRVTSSKKLLQQSTSISPVFPHSVGKIRRPKIRWIVYCNWIVSVLVSVYSTRIMPAQYPLSKVECSVNMWLLWIDKCGYMYIIHNAVENGHFLAYICICRENEPGYPLLFLLSSSTGWQVFRNSYKMSSS